MRKIGSYSLVSAVEQMVLDANFKASSELISLLEKALEKESYAQAKRVLELMLENIELARKKKIPICQDTGLNIFFIKLGKDVEIEGDLLSAINQGLRNATKKGYLRRSVCDPLSRKNTDDNTPAIVHIDKVNGEDIEIELLVKGAGAENKSFVKMLSPAEGKDGIKREVIKAVKKAGASACPPLFVGIGIGGTLELSALNAKKALLLPFTEPNPVSELRELEEEFLSSINALGIGASGLGGTITALGLKIISHPCHIASLPLGINLQCWVHRKGRQLI